MSSNRALVPAKTVRAFIAGNSGTGKTTFAREMYLVRFPRVIIIDMTGEWLEQGMDAAALSVAELQAAVRRLSADRGRWTVSIALDPEEMPALVDWLIPVPHLAQSPIRHMGGAVILVDEVDLLAPQGTAKTPIRTLYRRSRHVGLSVVSTTQRPANVSREVSAQSTHAASLRLSEPRDIDYMANLMRWSDADVRRWLQWVQTHPHGGAWRDLLSGEQRWFAGSPYRLERKGPRDPQGDLLEDVPDEPDEPAE